MKNYDETVSLLQGSDDGTDTDASIQPIDNNEKVWPLTTNRPVGHLRKRSEVLRRAIEDLLYYADADRAFVLRASSAFTFSEPVSGNYVLALASGDLWLYPALTPGRQSGGRAEGGQVFCENPSAAGAWTPYSGTAGVDDLVLTAHRQYTGQRGYADCDSYVDTPGGRSIGANRVFVDLVADAGVAGGTVTATISQQPRTKIRIVYGTSGTPTTLAQLIAFINADRTSQGTYGVADYLRASSTGTTTNPPVAFSGGQVQGAYDAEAHQVTKAQLDAFFAVQVSGAYVNRLREGEGLAIAYPYGPVERGTVSPDGGRRQAIWDLPTDRTGTRSQNTTPATGYALFSTGREPEKIPGAIPIGKVVNGEFVFIDGTRVGVGETLELGDSKALRAALALQASGGDGSRLVGYEGSGNWHADASATTSPALPASTVNASLTRVVANLASATTNQSGARRIGVEQIAPVISAGNEDRELSLGAGSLRQMLNAIVNGLDGASRLIGLNGRVSELGHRMLGADPLKKLFGFAGMPAAGAVFTQAELHAPTNQMDATPSGVSEFAHLVLQPLVFDDLGGAVLDVDEEAEVASATVIHFTDMTSDRFTKVVAYLPIVVDSTVHVPLVYARVTGLDGGAGNTDGFYVVKSHNTSAQTLTLQCLNGDAPSFSASGAIAVTLYSALAVGGNKRESRFDLFHVAGTNAAKRPLMNIGVGYPTQPVLDIYVPNGNTGTRGLRLNPKTIELEGVELNATKVGAIHGFALDESSLETDLAEDFTSPRTVSVTATPAGRTTVGVFVTVTAVVYSAGAGVVRYGLQAVRSGGAAVPLVLSVEWIADGAAETRTAVASAFIPLNNVASFTLVRTISTNVDTTPLLAKIQVKSIGRLLGFA